MSKIKKAFIIGSGVAGLASAIRLAVHGFEVIVFEKNNYPGGKLSDFTKGDFHFDAGPSLFTQPENIEELFALAGEPVEDYFACKKLDIACKYFYEDGTEIDGYASAEKLSDELETKTGEPAASVKKYLHSSRKAYSNIGEIFLNHSLHKKSTIRNISLLKAFNALHVSYLFSSLDKYNRTSFSKPHTVQLFNRYATYNGSNPFKAPAMLSMIPHLEFNEGVYYPEGGMISITNALYKLAIKKGVHFNFNTAVQRIICKDNEAKGIVANNQNHFSDIVLSNADAFFTYKIFLQDHLKASKMLKQERSSSALIFYWGINKEFPQLQLHNIFFSNNYQAEFDNIFRYKKLYSDPTVYINITSKCEPGIQCPQGKENWFVMVNAPANSGQDWDRIKGNARKSIIEKLNRLLKTDLEKYIEAEEISDPLVIEERTSSYMGSLYGTSSNSRLAAFLRHPNFSKEVKHLYFSGGSVHPGGGIPLCLKSAKITCNIIKEDEKKWKTH